MSFFDKIFRRHRRQHPDLASEMKRVFPGANVSVDNAILRNNENVVQDHHVERFLDAQQRDYEDALQEIKAGQKQSHWIWYIFPQIKGLGYSSMSEYYGIGSRAEAEAYLANETLNDHLREISRALLLHKGTHTAWEILGTTDALKVCSCMTLFDLICPNDIFAEVLDAFYEGERCEKTLAFLHGDLHIDSRF